MFIHSKHLILVLCNISNRSATKYSAVNRQISPLLLLQSAKLHSSSPSCRSIYPRQNVQKVDTDVPDLGQAMEAWYYDVQRDGKLTIRSVMDVHIQPIDPQKHPSMNKLFINILYMGKDRLSSDELTTLTKQYIVNVDLDELNEEMKISIKRKSNLPLHALCHLQVPIRYGVDVSCSKRSEASLENLESENVRVRTQEGNCVLKSIKGLNLDIKTTDGSVISSKVLQGNVQIVCGGSGSISVGRVQGQEVTCLSNQGDINAKAVYAETATFTSNTGNIYLGSCHGNSEIRTNEGHLTVDSLDGNLKGSVSIGNTQISMARAGNISFEAQEGDISLKVPKSVSCSVDVSGSQVDASEVEVHNKNISKDNGLTKLTGTLCEGSAEWSVNASTNKGKVWLGYYDWLASLNLTRQE